MTAKDCITSFKALPTVRIPDPDEALPSSLYEKELEYLYIFKPSQVSFLVGTVLLYPNDSGEILIWSKQDIDKVTRSLATTGLELFNHSFNLISVGGREESIITQIFGSDGFSLLGDENKNSWEIYKFLSDYYRWYFYQFISDKNPANIETAPFSNQEVKEVERFLA